MKIVVSLLLFVSLVQGQNFYIPKKIDKTGKTLVTIQIQNVLDKIAANNGGTLYFSAGKYLTGSLKVGKNTTIELDNGAELIASPNIKDYTSNHFIHAVNADNFTLKGKGTINGNGLTFFDKDWKPLERPEPWIVISNSKNVTIENVNFINSPAHVLVFELCDVVKVTGINIINDFKSPNTDGIDIVASRNVLISNCFISTGDDAICLKSKKDMDNKYATNDTTTFKGIENVVVTNCVLESDDAAIKMGTGSEYTTKNCLFSNIIIKNTRFGIALFMMDGGEYTDLTFSNIQIETNARHENHYAIFADIHQRKADSKVGKINNVNFNNITIKTEGQIYLSGHPQNNIENISLENIKLNVPFARNTEKWKKPRGNKTIEMWPTCADFTKEPASIIIGNANKINLKNIQINHQKGDMNRFGIIYKNVTNKTEDAITGNSLNQLELIKNN